MNFRRWIWVYLATGSSFTRWAILLYYGGAVVILGIVLVAVMAVAAAFVR